MRIRSQEARSKEYEQLCQSSGARRPGARSPGARRGDKVAPGSQTEYTIVLMFILEMLPQSS